MDFTKLREPFEADDIEWRVGQAGKSGERIWARLLAYITNRAIMNRLDEVCGPENWQNEFKVAPNDPKGESLLCGLSIRVNGEWVTKWDGAGNTDIESVKGGISDSMKRAGVQWGIGRYLYDLGESWASDCTAEKPAKNDMRNWNSGKTKDGTFFWWKPPHLPPEFLPKPAQKAPSADPPRGDSGGWEQWLTPPREALESDEPHPWYLSAFKEVMRHCGAQTAGNARAILAWLSPDEPIEVQVAKTRPEVAKFAWEKLMERNSTVPFTRMLNEALRHSEKAA